MIPKSVLVLRLFRANEIDNEHFDPQKVSRDSPKWIECKWRSPMEKGVYYTKSAQGDSVGKAFYISFNPLHPADCRWFHTRANEFIENSDISAWMPIYNTTTGESE